MKYKGIFAVLFAFSVASHAGAQSNNGNLWPIEGLPHVERPVFKSDTFNITKFGAVSDGYTLNTKSINSAIDAANANGGGVVLIPAGKWLTGPVVLKSNVNLHLAANALLSFTRDKSQYKLIESNWEGLPAVRNESPISGTDLENIALTGKGIIDGNGDTWRMVKKSKMTDAQWKKLLASGGVVDKEKGIWYPSEESYRGSKVKSAGVISAGKSMKDYEQIKDFLRPNLLVLTRCKRVLLEGLTIENSPAWNVHPLMCENLTLSNVYIKNPWYAQNGDGLDIESCKNVLVENSTFDVGDDGICIKSGRDAEGRKRAMPTENVLVKNCTVYHAHGGFVVGSEMSGGAKNIFVTDCTFMGTDIGIRFKTTRGRGGIVEKIYMRNINMKDIVSEAILFDMYYEARMPVLQAGELRKAPIAQAVPVTEETPLFKDLYVDNVVCDGAEVGVFVRGLPEMNVQNIALSNMTLQTKKAVIMEDASGISFDNIRFISEESNPLLDITNSSNISFNAIRFNPAGDLLFSVNGSRSKDINMSNTDVKQIKALAEYNFGASKKALRIR